MNNRQIVFEIQMKLISTNPSNNSIVGSTETSSSQEILAKVTLARKACREWSILGIDERNKSLNDFLLLVKENRKKLAILASQEMGMRLVEAYQDIDSGCEFLDWYIQNATVMLSPETTFEDEYEIHQIVYEPVGVIASIISWNFPFSNFIWQIGQGLISGNTYIVKHSELVALFCRFLESLIDQSHLPKGVLNFIYGGEDEGNFLVHQEVDMICFTGSTKVGKHLYRVASEKFIPIKMELGGSAPCIVFKDANIDEAIESIISNAFYNCGQVCVAPRRLLVEESIYSLVIDRLKKRVDTLKVGPAHEETFDIGPMASVQKVQDLETQIEESRKLGADIVSGGLRPKALRGAYYLPTLIANVNRDMRIWKEEVFGPVLLATSFTSRDQAISLANDTPYGLGAYVYTSDTDTFNEISHRIDTGMVSLNNVSFIKAMNPFGGTKDSGIGRQHGKLGFQEVTKTKVVSRQK
jgi:acyl-CoA reductase-like NAD-dependent aldehyde dehydrogenase